jgi:hypothetical protein
MLLHKGRSPGLANKAWWGQTLQLTLTLETTYLGLTLIAEEIIYTGNAISMIRQPIPQRLLYIHREGTNAQPRHCMHLII